MIVLLWCSQLSHSVLGRPSLVIFSPWQFLNAGTVLVIFLDQVMMVEQSAHIFSWLGPLLGAWGPQKRPILARHCHFGHKWFQPNGLNIGETGLNIVFHIRCGHLGNFWPTDVNFRRKTNSQPTGPYVPSLVPPLFHFVPPIWGLQSCLWPHKHIYCIFRPFLAINTV